MEGVHSRILTDGIELAKKECLRFLDDFRVFPKDLDKVQLRNVARTSISTKLHPEMANLIVDIIVDAVLCI